MSVHVYHISIHEYTPSACSESFFHPKECSHVLTLHSQSLSGLGLLFLQQLSDSRGIGTSSPDPGNPQARLALSALPRDLLSGGEVLYEAWVHRYT
jgi:hypothetical protein